MTRTRPRTPSQRRWAFALLTALAVLGLLVSLGLGAVPVAPSEVVWVIAHKLGFTFGSEASSSSAAVIWEIRLPRALLAGVVGAAFAGAGVGLSALSLVMLFFGQRLAKDYEGAAVLVPYFTLTVLGLYLFA